MKVEVYETIIAGEYHPSLIPTNAQSLRRLVDRLNYECKSVGLTVKVISRDGGKDQTLPIDSFNVVYTVDGNTVAANIFATVTRPKETVAELVRTWRTVASCKKSKTVKDGEEIIHSLSEFTLV